MTAKELAVVSLDAGSLIGCWVFNRLPVPVVPWRKDWHMKGGRLQERRAGGRAAGEPMVSF